MAKNRRRRDVAKLVTGPKRAFAWLGGQAGRAAFVAAAIGVLVLLGIGAVRTVLTTPYFKIREVEINETPHLSRDEVFRITGLDQEPNLFRFDIDEATQAMLNHPWVASATIKKILPDKVEIAFSERAPEGLAVMDGLFLVDCEGKPFVQPTPGEAKGLPVITGLSAERYEADPSAAQERIQEALALARVYNAHPLSKDRPLSDVHLDESGRYDLIVGRTRISIGPGRLEPKLEKLELIFAQLSQKQADASYIIFSEDLKRAIVKEISVEQGSSDSLTMRPEEAGSE